MEQRAAIRTDVSELGRTHDRRSANVLQPPQAAGRTRNRKSFARHPEHFDGVTSCNKNFRISDAATERWCGICPKCVFVYAIIRPFIDDPTPGSVSSTQLLHGCRNIDMVARLTGKYGHKPRMRRYPRKKPWRRSPGRGRRDRIRKRPVMSGSSRHSRMPSKETMYRPRAGDFARAYGASSWQDALHRISDSLNLASPSSATDGRRAARPHRPFDAGATPHPIVLIGTTLKTRLKTGVGAVDAADVRWEEIDIAIKSPGVPPGHKALKWQGVPA